MVAYVIPQRWDEKVDELVRSIWVVHVNDEPETPQRRLRLGGVAVAVAFAARAVAGAAWCCRSGSGRASGG